MANEVEKIDFGNGDVFEIPKPNNAEIVIKQGGVEKGRFTVNASEPVEIDIDSGKVNATDTNEKIYLVGATSQSENAETFSNRRAYIENGGLHAGSLYSDSLIRVKTPSGKGTYLLYGTVPPDNEENTYNPYLPAKSGTIAMLDDMPTKSSLGLGNVENKSSATIRGELTKANVTDALGYTPLQNHQDISGKLDKITGGGTEIAGNGKYRYCRLATLTITGGYINRPIVFEISGRGRWRSNVSVMFVSNSGTDPDLSSIRTDNDDCYYIKKIATSKWEMYGQYSETWGNFFIHRVTGSGTNNGVTVELNVANLDALPSGITVATGLGNAHYAASAGNAATVNGLTVQTAVPANAKFTDTWRPLGTGASDACAGNDSRLSNARPASDVSSWAKASSKPSYSPDDVGCAKRILGKCWPGNSITFSGITSAADSQKYLVIVSDNNSDKFYMGHLSLYNRCNLTQISANSLSVSASKSGTNLILNLGGSYYATAVLIRLSWYY